MLQPGRTFTTASSYRYGFNGQEKSTEIDANGNHTTATFWEYDSRIVRRWNIDPMNSGATSTFAAFNNNPIIYSDPFGLDTVKKASGLKNIGDVFQHYNAKTNSNFFYNKTPGGIEEAGSSQRLDAVDVTAKMKPRSWLGSSFNYTHQQTLRWQDERATAFHLISSGQPLNFKGAPEEYLTLLQNFKQEYQADQESRKAQLFVGGVFVAPFAASALAESGATYYLSQGGGWLVRNYGANFALEVTKEAFAQRLQIGKMDWSDIIVNTATSKLGFWGRAGGEIFNATNDFTFNQGFTNSFMPTGPNHKALTTALIDGGFGILKVGTGEGFFKEATFDQIKYEVNKNVEEH